MKKYMMIALVSLAALGCAHNAQVQSPANQTAGIGERGASNHEPDNFDKVGEVCADGSRWAWNESKKAYEYLSSDEMKQKYQDAWDATKQYVGEKYDEATSEENKAKAQELLDSAKVKTQELVETSKAKAEETYHSVTENKTSKK